MLTRISVKETVYSLLVGEQTYTATKDNSLAVSMKA